MVWLVYCTPRSTPKYDEWFLSVAGATWKCQDLIQGGMVEVNEMVGGKSMGLCIIDGKMENMENLSYVCTEESFCDKLFPLATLPFLPLILSLITIFFFVFFPTLFTLTLAPWYYCVLLHFTPWLISLFFDFPLSPCVVLYRRLTTFILNRLL